MSKIFILLTMVKTKKTSPIFTFAWYAKHRTRSVEELTQRRQRPHCTPWIHTAPTCFGTLQKPFFSKNYFFFLGKLPKNTLLFAAFPKHGNNLTRQNQTHESRPKQTFPDIWAQSQTYTNSANGKRGYVCVLCLKVAKNIQKRK